MSKNVNRPRVLILLKHYTPAFRFGGPIRSVANLIAELHDEFEFKVICLNRDFREASPLDGIEEGVWLGRDGAQVCYLDVSLVRPLRFVRAIRSVDFDIVYINSFFDPLFATLPAILMKMRLLKQRPIVIAPRGEFSPGALAFKSLKKSIFLRLQAVIDLYSGATWQATTALEAEDIKRVLGDTARILEAPNLSAKTFPSQSDRIAKASGYLKIAFISRISSKKNLLGLIAAVGELRGRIALDIWGPVDDADYLGRCQKNMSLLKPNIVATYRGEVPHEQVQSVLLNAHIFALPTFGENYGHIIFEAFAAGCPVVISDKTPWRDLAEAGVGFDVALEDVDNLVQALQSFVDMDAEKYSAYAVRCQTYAMNRTSDEADVEANKKLFSCSIGNRNRHCEIAR